MGFLSDNVKELLVAGILVVIALAIMQGVTDTQVNDTIYANSSMGTQPIAYTGGAAITTAIGGFSSWFTLLVLVIVGVVIFVYLRMIGGGGQTAL